jgi:hypothetical protein
MRKTKSMKLEEDAFGQMLWAYYKGAGGYLLPLRENPRRWDMGAREFWYSNPIILGLILWAFNFQ